MAFRIYQDQDSQKPQHPLPQHLEEVYSFRNAEKEKERILKKQHFGLIEQSPEKQDQNSNRFLSKEKELNSYFEERGDLIDPVLKQGPFHMLVSGFTPSDAWPSWSSSFLSLRENIKSICMRYGGKVERDNAEIGAMSFYFMSVEGLELAIQELDGLKLETGDLGQYRVTLSAIETEGIVPGLELSELAGNPFERERGPLIEIKLHELQKRRREERRRKLRKTRLEEETWLEWLYEELRFPLRQLL